MSDEFKKALEDAMKDLDPDTGEPKKRQSNKTKKKKVAKKKNR
jgi:hypothetical protein